MVKAPPRGGPAEGGGGVAPGGAGHVAAVGLQPGYYGDGGGEICIIKHNQISASNLGQADIQMIALLSTVELETNLRSLRRPLTFRY